jgi:UDP-N-acetylglucosamine 2-epimerase (non-hydrolysing)
VRRESIYVTGNTGIDALLLAAKMEHPFPIQGLDLRGKRLILVTAHRRESFGAPMQEILLAIRDVALSAEDIEVVYPVHMNPNVQGPAREILGGIPNVKLCGPMDYFDFVSLMKHAHLILTDSGGVQEEAPTLGVPVLVLRNETERPEAVEAGTVMLTGTRREDIFRQSKMVLEDPILRSRMASASNPYGDGKAAPRIADAVVEFLASQKRSEVGFT